MSTKDDLEAAGKELSEAKARMSMAGGCLAASMAVAHTLRKHEADVWRIVAVKRLTKLTRAYMAGILATADQLNEELKAINGKRGQDEK